MDVNVIYIHTTKDDNPSERGTPSNPSALNHKVVRLVMPIVAKLDELGKPAWIVVMILGFWFWWPLGLATLAFIYWSRRMGCWNHGMDRWEQKVERMRSRMGCGGDWWRNAPSSGNRAFDEYRTETLQRLEEEQVEFKNFLDRLRHAKDKEEFDQFMAQHKTRPTPPPADQQQG